MTVKKTKIRGVDYVRLQHLIKMEGKGSCNLQPPQKGTRQESIVQICEVLQLLIKIAVL